MLHKQVLRTTEAQLLRGRQIEARESLHQYLLLTPCGVGHSPWEHLPKQHFPFSLHILSLFLQNPDLLERLIRSNPQDLKEIRLLLLLSLPELPCMRVGQLV